MQKVSDDFVAAMDSAAFEARLTLDDGTDVIVGDAIQSIDFSGGANGTSDTVTLGGTVASTATITLNRADVSCEMKGRKILIELGIDSEWIPMGTYTVTDAVEDDDILTVTASDAFVTVFDVGYEALEGFDFDSDAGVDSVAFLKALCGRRGVEADVTGIEPIALKISPEGYTEREIIGFIAALHGGFADIDRLGVLAIRWYTASGITIDADRYYDSGMEKDTADFGVGWLRCYVEPLAETLTEGDAEAEQGIYFECPWMDEDILARIWEKIKNFSFRPVNTLNFLGDPRLDPGDIITLEDLEGNVHSVPVMSISHEYDGGMITTISANGQSQDDSYEGPVEREKKRLYSRIVKKQNEIELSIRNFDGDKIVSLINMSETEILIQASKIRLEGLVTANSNFKVLEDGSIEAANAVISGKITATGGSVGGWDIGSSLIYKNKYDSAANMSHSVALRGSNSTMAFAVYEKEGEDTDAPAISDGWSYNFYVSYEGHVYAKKANITGEINATSGIIGDCSITNGKLDISANDSITGLSSRITQTAESITSEVSRATAAENSLSSKITQNAESITSEVSRATAAENSLSSKITQTAESITSEVNRATAAENSLSSRITQTAESITSEVNRATAAENSLSSRITQTAESITSVVSKKVGSDEIISKINQSAEDISIQASRISLEGIVTANNYFKILADGSVQAVAGTIGGWNITNTKLYAGDGEDIKTVAIQIPKSTTTWVFAAGGSSHDSYSDCPFRVSKAGKLYATDAVIEGEVTATSGTIGGCSITGGKLTVPAAYISGKLTASQINADGITAEGVTVSGSVTATSGKIGGWNLTAITPKSAGNSEISTMKGSYTAVIPTTTSPSGATLYDSGRTVSQKVYFSPLGIILASKTKLSDSGDVSTVAPRLYLWKDILDGIAYSDATEMYVGIEAAESI